MTLEKSLETVAQMDRRRKQKIEDFIYDKFKEYKNENFLIKASKSWDEDELVDYEAMVEHLTEVVDQYLFDEVLETDELQLIEPKQWDKWLESYEVPEKCCDRCGGRGCNYCLMCDY